jgi:hypothetical protein
MVSRVSCCLSATGIGLSGHPIPAGELGLPHGRLTGHQPGAGPQRGSHVLHVPDTTGEGAPSTPGTAVFSRPDDLPDRRLPLPNGQSLHPAGTSHRRGYSITGHQRGFTRFTRCRRPLACSPRMGREPSGFPLSFAPRRYQRRTSGRGRA